jgi:hypothetical protein
MDVVDLPVGVWVLVVGAAAGGGFWLYRVSRPRCPSCGAPMIVQIDDASEHSIARCLTCGALADQGRMRRRGLGPAGDPSPPWSRTRVVITLVLVAILIVLACTGQGHHYAHSHH